MDTASYNLSCSFHGLSAWNHIHGRLQCSGNTDSIAFLLFPKKDMGFFCGTICRNVLVMLGDLYYPVTILGHHFEIPQQSFALLALIPIWLYNREQGYHSKWFKYFCYAFYPAHLLILFIIWQWSIR